MQIQSFLEAIEKIFPAKSAMQGDKIGLQLQSGNSEVHTVLIAFEINENVIYEAIKAKADMIFAFHPLIFNPLSQITNNDRVGNLVTQLIINSISLFIAHTNFDSFRFGTSRLLADELELKTISFLEPNKDLPNFGMGIIAEPLAPISEFDLLNKLKSITNSPIRHNTLGKDKLYSRIAIVGGSGFSFINKVIESNCDAFITADCSYHKFHEVNNKLLLIDPGHFEMEQFVAKGMYNTLNEFFKDNTDIEFIVSEINTNPVCYF